MTKCCTRSHPSWRRCWTCHCRTAWSQRGSTKCWTARWHSIQTKLWLGKIVLNVNFPLTNRPVTRTRRCAASRRCIQPCRVMLMGGPAARSRQTLPCSTPHQLCSQGPCERRRNNLPLPQRHSQGPYGRENSEQSERDQASGSEIPSQAPKAQLLTLCLFPILSSSPKPMAKGPGRKGHIQTRATTKRSPEPPQHGYGAPTNPTTAQVRSCLPACLQSRMVEEWQQHLTVVCLGPAPRFAGAFQREQRRTSPCTRTWTWPEAGCELSLVSHRLTSSEANDFSLHVTMPHCPNRHGDRTVLLGRPSHGNTRTFSGVST